MRTLAVAVRLSLGLVAAAMSSSCSSLLSLRSSRTVASGRYQVAVAPSAAGVVTGGGVTSLFPQLEVAVRRGITSTADVGLRIGVGQLAIEGGWQVYRSKSRTSGIDVLFAPMLGYGTWGVFGVGVSQGTHGVDLQLPVLFGLNLPREVTLIAAPRLSQRIAILAGAGTSYIVTPALSVAVDVPVWRTVHLLPEAGISFPYQVASSITPGAGWLNQGAGFQIGLGILIGGHSSE